MSTWRSMQDGGPGKIEWILEVAGVFARYYSGPVPPPSKLVPGGAGVAYVDIPSIVETGDLVESVEAARGYVEASPVSLVLGSEGTYARTAYDAAEVFGALGRRAAASYAQVIADVDASGVFIATLDRQWTGTVPGFAHIDRECVRVTAASAVAPWTATFGTRAVAGSWAQQHLADPLAQIFPELTDRIVQWRGRPAYLWAAMRYPGAVVLDTPVLWLPGVIASTPTVDGPRVSIQVAGLTALIDRSVGGARQVPREVQLQTGLHRFWRTSGSRTRPYAWSCCLGIDAADDGPRDWTTAASAPNQVTLTAAGFASHGQWYWPAGLPGLGAGRTHPRWGHLVLDDLDYQEVTGVVPAPPANTLAAPGSAGPAAGVRVSRAPSREVYCVDLVPAGSTSADYAWPEGVGAVFGARAPGTANAQAGAWLDVYFDGRAGQLRLAKPQSWLRDPQSTVAVALRQFDDTANPTTAQPPGVLPWGNVWARGGLTPRRWDLNPVAGGLAPSFDESVSYPIRLDGIPQVAEFAAETRRGGFASTARWWMRRVNGSQELQCTVALGWHEVGEPSVFVDADPGIPAVGCLLRVDWVEPGGEVRSRRIRASGPAVLDAVAGAACYRIDLVRPWEAPSFGSWPGEDPCTITPVIGWGDDARVPSGQLLLELLESGGGSGALGTYDVQPWGCGIPSAYIDEDSFLAHQDPPGLDGWSIEVAPGTDLSEILTSILVATGSQIVVRRSSTGARLSRVAVGVSVAPAAVASIGATDPAGLPRSSVDEYTVSEYRIQTSQAGTTEPRESTWIDQRSVATHGEGQTLELDLRGLYLPSTVGAVVGTLAPVIAHLAQQLGSPRRTWEIDVPTPRAIALWPGADVLITSPWLHGAEPRPGVTSAAARLTSVGVTLSGATARLVLEYHGENTTLINAACRVTATPGPNTVRVSSTYYTDGEDPATGEATTDVAWLAVGDSVWVHPIGDDDTGVTRTVVSVTVAGASYDVLLSGAHGLPGTTGIVEPSPYPTGGAAADVLAYLADAAGTLGPAPDPGYVYT